MAVSVSEILAPTASSSSVASFTGTYSGSATIGDIVIVQALSSGAGTFVDSSLSDLAGNKYVIDQQSSTATPFARTLTWRSIVSNPIIGGTTTLTLGGGSAFKGLSAIVITPQGGGVVLALDKKNQHGNIASGTTADTGASGTLSSAYSLAIAQYAWLSGDTFSEPPSFTNPHGAGVRVTTSGATINSTAWTYQFVSVTTSLNPVATLGASLSHSGHIITYLIQNQYSYTPTKITSSFVGPQAQRNSFKYPQNYQVNNPAPPSTPAGPGGNLPTLGVG